MKYVIKIEYLATYSTGNAGAIPIPSSESNICILISYGGNMQG